MPKTATSGYADCSLRGTHIVYFHIFAHLTPIDVDLIDGVVKREHEVFNGVVRLKRTNAQRAMFTEVEGQQFAGIDTAQLMKAVIDDPGDCRLVLKQEQFIVTAQIQADARSRLNRPAASTPLWQC